MTASYIELIARPEVDVVDICVPTPDHHEIALAALRAGKHVICEKPLARTAAIAGQIADLAEQSKSFFMTAMCMRFWPQWAWLKQAVVERRYGKVLSAHFTPPRVAADQRVVSRRKKIRRGNSRPARA